MLSYAGVSLDWFQPQVDLGGELGPSFLVELAARTWPGHELSQLGFEAALPALPHRTGQLSWPRGAARFACGDVCFPNIVEQGGLPVVDVAHDGNYWWAGDASHIN